MLVGEVCRRSASQQRGPFELCTVLVLQCIREYVLNCYGFCILIQRLRPHFVFLRSWLRNSVRWINLLLCQCIEPRMKVYTSCFLLIILVRGYAFRYNNGALFDLRGRQMMRRGSLDTTDNTAKPVKKKLLSTLVTFVLATVSLCMSGSPASTADIGQLPVSSMHSPLINVLPTVDFWYPPYVLGDWKSELIFQGAKFTDKIPLAEISSIDNNIPGFAKYSVFFVPNIGKDATGVSRRYVQLDSHPREDHSYNIRQLVTAFAPDTVVDSAAYGYQTAPALFNSPGNKWKIKYHDSAGEGEVELRTTKRFIAINAGTLETTEHFVQKHTRRDYAPDVDAAGTTAVALTGNKVTLGDYAINWKLSVPASGDDDFVAVSDLSKSNSLVGELNILVYPQPTSDIYMKIPKEPVGTFTYQVKLQRIGSEEDATKNSVYPFVFGRDGAVELKDYFGY